MNRRTRNLFFLVLLAVAAATGGAALFLSDTKMLDPDDPLDLSVVEGVVIAIDSGGLADVRGFTLRRVGGETIVFVLGELENAQEFPPGHLAEHQATAERVRVFYRTEGVVRFAIRLEDAGD